MWFIPNSSMPHNISQENIFRDIVLRTPKALFRLSRAIFSCEIQKPTPISACRLNNKIISISNQLEKLFIKFGSDKSLNHKYHDIYAMIIANFVTNPKILEIGLGSQNTSIPSHVNSNFKPGGSLIAFQTLLPGAIIHGADIDPTISCDDFKLFTIDQTKPETFSKIHNEGEKS